MKVSTDGFIQPGRSRQQKPGKRVELPGFKPQNRLNLDAKPLKAKAAAPETLRNPGVNSADARKPASVLGFSSYQPSLGQAAKPINLQLEDANNQEGGAKKPKRSYKKIIIRSFLAILAAAIIGAGYLGWRAYHNTGHVFKGNVFKAIFSAPQQLKTDAYGRSNILIFGTSEDDPNHAGADLTDSIMFISLDQKNHNAFIVSVPRDIWVQYPAGCQFGSAGKINAVYLCAKGKNDETAGQTALRDTIKSVFGIDLQYSVHVDYKVVRDSINALGGVDITIASPDPRGILDRNFDWRCNYKCYLVKYPNGPVHLNGEQALYLAQARGEGVGYGLPRANFDREADQRKIILAAKDKATSIGFLSNPLSITRLLDSLGNNVRTNFDASEIKSLMGIIKDTNSNSIDSVSLIDQTPALLTSGVGPDGTSIVRPAAGLLDYSGLTNFTHAYLTGKGPLIKEKAVVDVLNASGIAGNAKKEGDLLAADGIGIGYLGNAAQGNYGKLKLYDLSKGTKPATKQELEKFLGVTSSTDPLPAGYKTTANFVVIVGISSAASTSNTNQTQ